MAAVPLQGAGLRLRVLVNRAHARVLRLALPISPLPQVQAQTISKAEGPQAARLRALPEPSPKGPFDNRALGAGELRSIEWKRWESPGERKAGAMHGSINRPLCLLPWQQHGPILGSMPSSWATCNS